MKSLGQEICIKDYEAFKGLECNSNSSTGKSCLCRAPVASGQSWSLRRRQRPMALVTDVDLAAQAADGKMIRMEIFSSEDLTWLWNSGIKIGEDRAFNAFFYL